MTRSKQNKMNQEDLQQKYLFTNLHDLSTRVSHYVASNENSQTLRTKWQQHFHQVITSREFVPSGNTLAGAGTEKTLQPNCAVIGEINDGNCQEILNRSKVLWQKAIGIGFFVNTSDPVKTLLELASVNEGISLWNKRPKRGNMAVISIDHQKLEEVITYKAKNPEALSTFNISIAITNDFMQNVLSGGDDITWKSTGRTCTQWLSMISDHAWKCGDPGVVFIDRVQGSPISTEALGPIKASVPCGEQFLHDNETCNLGVINLNAPSLFDEQHHALDWKRLKEVVCIGVRFLDNVVDLLQIPDELMSHVSKQCRRVGLGVAGWADLLEKMHLPYDSKQALELASHVSHCITTTATTTSRELATEKGECPLRPSFRNISVTCIQPTGGITPLLGNKGYAIEPFFEHANLLSFEAHIDMQRAWQQNIEQAISKTINMDRCVSVEHVFEAYVYAYEKECKGITIYRDGSKTWQPKCLSCEQDNLCKLTR